MTVDPELVAAGNRSLEVGGCAESLSGWVNAALGEQARRDERLEALSAAVADYETEFAEITAEELAVQRRLDRQKAVVVRGRRTSVRR